MHWGSSLLHTSASPSGHTWPTLPQLFCMYMSVLFSFPCHPGHIQDKAVLDVCITQRTLEVTQKKIKQKKKKRPQSRIARDMAKRWMRKECCRGAIRHASPDTSPTCVPILVGHSGTEIILSDWLHCYLLMLNFMRNGVIYWTLWNRDRWHILIISQYPDTKIMWEDRKLHLMTTGRKAPQAYQRINGLSLIAVVHRNCPRWLCPCVYGQGL